MRLRSSATTALAAVIAIAAARPLSGQSIADRYRADANRIIDAALKDSTAWTRLAEMTEKFGNRLSGTPALEQTIDWVIAKMKEDGLQNVRGERVMVPVWVRGTESAQLVSPRVQNMPMLGLGGSIATPPGGITADVFVVSTFSELTQKAAQAKGKIVLFDAPFTSYGETVQYRARGAVAAAQVGAVAALVRSVTPFSMRTPHTGGMSYDSTVRRIPTAAITVEDAQMLHRLQDRGERIRVKLTMSARMLPDAPSRNVMGEIVGSERPDEVVVFGGHIDSWDVGRGAMDDGGGVVVAWEAVKLLQRLGLKPRRTIRVVGWTNEENGGRGGQGYRDAHKADVDKHMLAIESDGGVFKPQGFSFAGSDAAMEVVKQIATLLDRIEAGAIVRGGAGADVGPIVALGVPGLGLNVDGTKYFWYHHTEADTIEKLDAHEMALCVATMAVMAYVVADMAEPLPRATAATR
jgi:carboxypeptidase Q